MSSSNPYNTFGRYNKNEKVEESPSQATEQQHKNFAIPYGSSKGIRQSQSVTLPSGGITTTPSYTGGQVPNTTPKVPDTTQQVEVERKTRFRTITTPQEMFKIITEGHQNFQESFKARNMKAPPMKIFLKLHTDWCGPCKQIAPVLDEVSTLPAFSGVIFLEFNADQMKGDDPIAQRLASMLQISAVPAFFTFIDGKLTGKQFSAERQGVLNLVETLLQ